MPSGRRHTRASGREAHSVDRRERVRSRRFARGATWRFRVEGGAPLLARLLLVLEAPEASETSGGISRAAPVAMRSFRTGAMAAMMASPSAWADDPESMSEGSDTSTDRASSSAHTSSSLAARRAARAEARTEAREVRALRCRAAREKLRVVHRAISDHDEYLAELDAYERASLAYRAKVAAVEAAEATKRAAREALRLVGLDPSEDLSDQNPGPPPAP